MATTCRKRRISRRSTCSYRSEREQFCHDTLPWLISVRPYGLLTTCGADFWSLQPARSPSVARGKRFNLLLLARDCRSLFLNFVMLLEEFVSVS